jgi:uncharacterized protein (DUF952 family)
MNIYHLIKREDWNKIKDSDVYHPQSLNEVGFIHCSTREQVLPTANRRYADQDIVVLEIDLDRVPSKTVFEDLKTMGEEHPHIYGNLPLDAVVKVLELGDL